MMHPIQLKRYPIKEVCTVTYAEIPEIRRKLLDMLSLTKCPSILQTTIEANVAVLRDTLAEYFERHRIASEKWPANTFGLEDGEELQEQYISRFLGQGTFVTIQVCELKYFVMVGIKPWDIWSRMVLIEDEDEVGGIAKPTNPPRLPS